MKIDKTIERQIYLILSDSIYDACDEIKSEFGLELDQSQIEYWLEIELKQAIEDFNNDTRKST